MSPMTDLIAAIRRNRLGIFVAASGLLLAWVLWSAHGALPAFVIGIALAFGINPLSILTGDTGTDVIKEGFVASLGRPGGNITGLTWDVGLEIMAKRFEFLKEALPTLSRVAVLWDPGQDAAGFESVIKEGGASVGVKLIWVKITDDLASAFAEAQRAGAEAIFTGGGARLFRSRRRCRFTRRRPSRTSNGRRISSTFLRRKSCC